MRPEEVGPQISVRHPRGIAIDRCSNAAIPSGMVSGAIAERMVRAPGMRLASEASIWVRRAEAAELKGDSGLDLRRIRFLFAYGSMILAVLSPVVKKPQGVGYCVLESHNGSKRI